MILSVDCLVYDVVPHLSPLAQWSLSSACPSLALPRITKHRRSFWKEAISSNNSQLVKWMSQDNHMLINLKTFAQVASHCSLEVVQPLIHQLQNNYQELRPRAANPDLKVHKLLDKHGFRWSNNIFDKAAMDGNLLLMQWLLMKKYRITPRVFERAAENGNLVNIQWLYQHGFNNQHRPTFWNSWTFAMAAKNGNIELLSWLKQQKCPMQSSALLAAIDAENISAVEWLIHEGCEMNEPTFHAALLQGNEQILSVLIHNKCPYNLYGYAVCSSARLPATISWSELSQEAKTHMAQWAVDKNDVSKLECLKSMGFLQELLTTDLFQYAVLAGPFNMMKWLDVEGCPHRKKSLSQAIRKDECDKVLWLMRHYSVQEAQVLAREVRSVAMVECLRSLGVVWNRSVYLNENQLFELLEAWKALPSVEFLEANGFKPRPTLSPELLVRVLLEDNIKLADWLAQDLVKLPYIAEAYLPLKTVTSLDWLVQRHIMLHPVVFERMFMMQSDDVLAYLVTNYLINPNIFLSRLLKEGSLELMQLVHCMNGSLWYESTLIAHLKANGNKKLKQWMLTFMAE